MSMHLNLSSDPFIPVAILEVLEKHKPLKECIPNVFLEVWYDIFRFFWFYYSASCIKI